MNEGCASAAGVDSESTEGVEGAGRTCDEIYDFGNGVGVFMKRGLGSYKGNLALSQPPTCPINWLHLKQHGRPPEPRQFFQTSWPWLVI